MIKIIREVTKEDLENWIYTIDENDSALYEEANNPDKIGIFQLNGATAEKLCDEIKPENFDEVVAINAMARPGPLETCAPHFVKRKSGEASPYPDVVNKILEDTHYTFLYQEQIIETFHKVGGFTLEEADEVRGLMKKLSKAEKDPDDVKKWEKVVKKFVKGAAKEGIDESMAISISKDLAAFSGYSFNKAHAASYGYIALITLYLSKYFRKYFYSSVLTYETDREKYLLDRISSVRKQGIEILPPDINKSKAHFSPDGNAIRLGLGDIKFVSESATNLIAETRPFKSIFDFYLKTKSRTITIKTIEALASVGVFDCFYPERKRLIQILKTFWENKKSIKIEEKLKDAYDKSVVSVEAIPALDTTMADLIEYEKTFYGFKIFSTPFTNSLTEALTKMREQKLIYLVVDEIEETSKKIPVLINKIRSYTDRNGNEMGFMEVEDIYGVTISLPVFASYWKHIKYDLRTENIYLLNVYLGDRDNAIFGQREWTDNEFKIKRMVKKIE